MNRNGKHFCAAQEPPCLWIDTFRVEYLAQNPGWGFHLWDDAEAPPGSADFIKLRSSFSCSHQRYLGVVLQYEQDDEN